ncbi:hypothetical protein KDW_41330 [Dictyobacter vulcani]|uniref:Knr4/Smi1-like domain-containing protein n=2 Tax=Dictyobacter vulcani TaxID=2607529 RepID=A0A5J4KU25_9CHLR|nr:hypothetical protein KDW_41330 [Dictyobacter vulcani]
MEVFRAPRALCDHYFHSYAFYKIALRALQPVIALEQEMNMGNVYDTLTEINMIKERLNEHSCIRVLDEEGDSWDAYFSFTLPAKEPEIADLESRWYIPPSYKQFLSVSNGAVLYKDVQYGQWGFYLYGTKDLITKNEQWHKLYSSLPNDYLVFAESLGDADFLIINTCHPEETNECVIIGSDVGYEVSTWPIIAQSFAEWLSYLVNSQGAKYWEN